MKAKELKGLIEAYASVYAPQGEVEQLDEISDTRVQGMLAKRAQQDKDSGGISAGYMANKRAQQAAARRNVRTGSNVRVDPILSKEETELEEGRWNNPRWNEYERQNKAADAEDRKKGLPQSYTDRRNQRRLALGPYRPGAPHSERQEAGRQNLRDQDKVPKKGGKDMFEHILEYLVAEGYADTNKAAIAIMANMSEEWKQSIIEDVYMGPPIKQEKPQPKVEKKPSMETKPPASAGRGEVREKPARSREFTNPPS